MEKNSFAGGTFRSLRHKNFRDYFIGQAVSNLGTWLQIAAVGWLVWELTGSEERLGWINFIGRIPALFVSLFVGVFVDRYSRKTLVVLSQVLAMLQAAAMALLTYSGHVSMGWIEILAVALGLISALDVPARQALMVEMVGREDLSSAIPLNSAIFNLARLIGPGLAGLLLARTSAGFCFTLNAASYLIVVGLLLRMDVPGALPPTTKKVEMGRDIREGIAFAMRHCAIRDVLLYMAVIGSLAYTHAILLPSVATELGRAAGGYGLLLGSSGLGAVLGALYLARVARERDHATLIAVAGLAIGVSLVLFSYCTNFWVSFALLVPAGFGMMVQSAGTNTLIQEVSPEALRGRILSLYSLVFMGLFPVGALVLGLLGEHWGSMRAIRLGGALCFIGGGIVLARVPRIRASIAELEKLQAGEAKG